MNLRILNLHRSINRVQLIEVEIDQIAIDSKLYRLHIRNRNNRDQKSKDDNPILLNAKRWNVKDRRDEIKFLNNNRSASCLIFRFNTIWMKNTRSLSSTKHDGKSEITSKGIGNPHRKRGRQQQDRIIVKKKKEQRIRS